MPVALRRPQEQNNKLQNFLQTLNVAAGIGGRISDYFQNKNQLDLQNRQLGLQEGQEADNDASRVLAMGLNSGEAARNANLAQLAATGQTIDPQIALSAITVGDIPDPVQRQATREAVAQLLDRSPDEIDDRFILSPDTLASESKRDISSALESTRNFRRITAQGQLGPGADVAAQVGETGMLSLVPGSNVQSFARTQALNNQINELLRVQYDSDTGDYRLDGAALNNAGPTLDILLQMVGENPLPKEFDPAQFGLPGPNRIVSGPMWNDLAKLGFQSLFQSTENARQSIREQAQLVQNELDIPYADALAAVEGRYGDMTVGNAQLFQTFQNYNRGMIEFIGNMNPINRQLITLGQTLSQEWGLPSDQIIEALSAMTEQLHKDNPGFPVVKNIGALQGMMGAVFGGPTGFSIQDGSVLTPQTGSVTGSALERRQARAAAATAARTGGAQTPEQTSRDQALMGAFEQLGRALAAMTPDQRAQAADSLVGLQAFTDPQTGEPMFLNVTQEMVDELLGNLP